MAWDDKNYFWRCKDCKNKYRMICQQEGLCVDFESFDGKRPRFCRLASSVEEMAKVLCEEHDFSMLISDEDYETEDEERKQKAIVAAAKKWLMEVV